MVTYELQHGPFSLSTDPARLNLDVLCAFLGRAYWSENRPREVIEKSLQHSLCFGMYNGDQLIGFARVVSDCAVFAYLCDVFIDEQYRGQGLGQWFIAGVMSHPDLQGLRRWALATRDAHSFYRKLGWRELRAPENWMEVFNP